jgi:hypothetical protein
VAAALAALGPMPPSPRRPHRRDDQETREIAVPATLPGGPPASVAAPGAPRASLCLVLAASADIDWSAPALVERTLDESRESERVLREVVAPQGGQLELLADGSVVVSLVSAEDPIGLVKQAAHAALALRRRLPEMSMMLATEVEGKVARPESVMALIDRGVRVLGADALAAIFAEYRSDPPPVGAIRIDGLAARLLQREFELVQARSGFFLIGERHGQS